MREDKENVIINFDQLRTSTLVAIDGYLSANRLFTAIKSAIVVTLNGPDHEEGFYHGRKGKKERKD